jgi:hypothetical protein
MSVATELAAPARARSLGIPLPVALATIPLGFILLGLVIRYLAYAAAVPDESIGGFANGLCQWDCAWYIHIAERGYDPYPIPKMLGAGNWAFFPLMPMLVGFAHAIVQQPTIWVATILSIALSYVTALIAWPLLERNLRAYTLFSAYLLAGPFSIYFTTIYTEVLFILLSTATLLMLQRRNYVGAGLFAGLLSATRIVGVVMALAMLVQAFVDHRTAGRSFASFIPAVLKRPDIVLGLFLAPLGLALYIVFLQHWMGDGLAFLHVQRAWARAYGNPAVFVWDALTSWPKGSLVPTAPQQLATAVLVGFGLTALLAWRRQWAAASFAVICMVIPLFAGMASTMRFTAALAPLAILACLLLAKNRYVFVLSLIGFFVADYFVAVNWIGGALSLV